MARIQRATCVVNAPIHKNMAAIAPLLVDHEAVKIF
jgi:hypothetical protein